MEPGAPDMQDFVVVEDEDFDDYNPEIPPQDPEVIREIKLWLQPTDYLADSSEYNKHLHNHVAGTGLWMQKTEAYRSWHDSPSHGSLWIKAIAGAGKSVFAAMIAEQLARTEHVPVLTFFFRQIVATNHHPQSLVRDWLAMVLEISPPLQARMKKHMDDQRNIESITTNELWQDLVHTLISMPKVYLVVDALDEMDIDEQDFFRHLVRLGKRKPASIKLLMTSRPLPRIEVHMKDQSISQVRLEQSKVDQDITIYVSHRLDQEDDLSLDLKMAIKQAVGEKAQGSFLYARLMMDELLTHLQQMAPDLASVQRSLTWLPNSLEDMYNGMLWDHSLRSSVPQSLQLTILSWVTHSTRPLRLLELASVVDAQVSPPKHDQARTDTKAVVRAACGPLLEILEDETISVIHHSFTEFLTDTDRGERPSSTDYAQFPVIIPAYTHKNMAMSCLDYLSRCLKDWILPIGNVSALHSEFRQPLVKKPVRKSELRMENPFLEYASSNWYIHIRSAETIDQQFISTLDGFMDINNHVFNAWVDMTWNNGRDKFKILPLHISAWAGLVSYTRHLLLGTVDSNALDSRRRTPLSYAAAKGYTDVVALLLEHVKDPNVDCSNGLKPIHYAAQANHYQVIRLLLQAGVSPITGKTKDPGRRCGNSASSIGHTPLMYACQAGGLESVREMIPFLTIQDLTRALCWAAEAGKADVVDLVLTSGKVLVDGPEYSTTALFLAAGGLHFEVMRSLLKAGADVNRKCVFQDRNRMHFPSVDNLSHDDLGSTPLHALCTEAQHSRFRTQVDQEIAKKCFFLLMNAGCHINPIDEVGKTPLHYCTFRQTRGGGVNIILATLLLNNGADPKMRDHNGDTPLHLLKLNEGSAALVRLFMEQGADICARRKTDGRTPIHMMMDSIHKIDIGPLLPYVPNWNAQDNEGDTPLHIVLAKSYNVDSCLQDLLNAGADVKLKNHKGEVPHLLMRDLPRGLSDRILPELIAAGADLEARDNDGKTILLRALSGNAVDLRNSIQTLLGLGANLHAVDNGGDGALHTVCARLRDASIVKYLIEAGADPLVTNHAGNNLLHTVLDNPSPDFDRLEGLLSTLFELGVCPSSRNSQLKTPLHFALHRLPAMVYGAKGDSLDFILATKIGENINSMDKDGIRPIHLAATLTEHLVAKLIQHGADPFVVTYERKNLLHIAARVQKPNTIGLLLEYFAKNGQLNLVNEIDDSGRSPLHYACRSGRSESVALLLGYGADVNLPDKHGYMPLHACAEFIEENLLWTSNASPTKGTVLASGILNSDLARPMSQQPPNRWVQRNHWASISNDNDTKRVAEIVRMLLDYGAELIPSINRRILDPFNYAVQCGCSEMVNELKGVMEKADADADAESHDDSTSASTTTNLRSTFDFKTRYILNHYNASMPWNDILPTEDKATIANILLRKHQYQTIRTLPEMGVDFAPQSDRPDFMTTLAQFGYVDLFKQLGASIKNRDWINGLHSAKREDKKNIMPYLITAVRRNLPNLEIIKAIIEEFGANVNIQPEVMKPSIPGEKVFVPGSSALHVLAEGGDWWKTKGIEYLLQRGADANARNEFGLTALALTVSSNRAQQTHRRFQNAELLLKHGADPNVLDDCGVSCLSKAMHDVKLVRLLIEHGADITLGDRPILIAAITALDIAAVSVILESGADCNVKRKSLTYGPKILHKQPEPKDYNYYPLHFAASAKFNAPKTRSTAIRIIALLLANNANVYLKYDNEDTISNGGTILHEIFRSGGILQPFLETPNLDLEDRDQGGNTLLLAAASSNAGTSTPTAAPHHFSVLHLSHEERIKSRTNETSGDPPVCQTIYNLGGDLTAINGQGNNVLHILTGVTPHNEDEHRKTFSNFISIAPKLVDMPNKTGTTPLHLALQYRRWWIVETLLEAGANALLPDAEGNTPLHHIAPLMCAAQDANTWLEWFNKFIALGVSINAQNNLGETPLFAYFMSISPYREINIKTQSPNAHRRCFAPFRNAGADIFVRNNEGQTLLHVIPKQASGEFPVIQSSGEVLDSFRFLMEMGVDPMAEDKHQRTALDVAAARGKQDILDLFKRDNGAPAGAVIGSVPPVIPRTVTVPALQDSDYDW